MICKSLDADCRDVLRDDFFLAAKVVDFKKKLKQKFFERCQMEAEKIKKEGKSLYDLSVSPFLTTQAQLKEDVGEEANIVFMTYDVSPFGIGFILHTVLCSNRKSYRRIVSAFEFSKFVQLNEQGAIKNV